MDEEQAITTEDLLPLKQAEIDLLHLIRTTHRFGEVTIETRDGAPTFLIRTINRTKLG